MFVVSRGGNLSTDSSVRRQKRFQSALQKFQRFTGSLQAGTFLEHVCQAVSCPDQNLPRPGLTWCRRSTSEKRNWLLPLGGTAAYRNGICPHLRFVYMVQRMNPLTMLLFSVQSIVLWNTQICQLGLLGQISQIWPCFELVGLIKKFIWLFVYFTLKKIPM